MEQAWGATSGLMQTLDSLSALCDTVNSTKLVVIFEKRTAMDISIKSGQATAPIGEFPDTSVVTIQLDGKTRAPLVFVDGILTKRLECEIFFGQEQRLIEIVLGY